MKAEERETAKLPLELPKPINRHILIKTPITYSDIVDKGLKLSDSVIQERRQEQFNKLFPDFTVKYEIVAIAEDCMNKSLKEGDFITLSHGGSSRPMKEINRGDYTLITEGDIALIWSPGAIAYNLEHYKVEEKDEVE